MWRRRFCARPPAQVEIVRPSLASSPQPAARGIKILLATDGIDGKIRELTPRNWGNTLKACIARVNEYLIGWIGFFGICTVEVGRTLSNLDAHIRRRLRAIQLKQWKTKRTIAQQLIRRGVKSKHAWNSVYGGRKSIWAMSILFPVHRALPNSHWDDAEEWSKDHARGLESLERRYRLIAARRVAPVQLTLALG